MKSQMPIGRKLLLAFGATITIVLALSISSLWSLNEISGEFDTEIKITSKKVELASAINTLAYEMRAAQRGVVMYSLLKQPDQIEKAKALFQTAADDMQSTVAKLRPMLYKPAAIEATDRIQAELAAWLPRYKKVLDLCAKEQFDAELSNILIDTGAANTRMNQDTDVLLSIQKGIQDEAGKSSARTQFVSRSLALLLTIVCIVVGVIVLFVVRQINRALREIASRMGEGALQVTAAASQLASSSESLAQGASEQAASVQETSASAEQISSMTRRNAESSTSAAVNMKEASNGIDDANRTLEQMILSMDNINACSEKIASIIKVIDEIAFQTNILALNAAVEAARAGDTGMGFAIVADEVRNLAQRSATAARDTTTLIEESIAKSHDGSRKLEQVAVAVKSITGTATKVKTLVEEVKYGSEEQSRGVEQVAKAVNQIESVTRTIAANAEESAAASQELTAQAETLRTLVTRLNQMVGVAKAKV